ncbi:MAG: methionyl-tRNA formyltransferase, methionyl-tRNA formyltransferase [Candidatus Taylorbacteria bacterium]|nr:methionyl-tRNA formyltransferase, methionyl-tRNA formyltransferase [Candidatus Taylorbacteria bacterium]
MNPISQQSEPINSQNSFVFFGSSPISVASLNSLRDAGYMPNLIITQPDKPQGRHLKLVPSPVKVWAIENRVEYLTPGDIKSSELFGEIKKVGANVGVLVSYGEMIPHSLLDVFPKGILNLHPSLLPKLRGPSPIETAILNDMKDRIGVTVMLLDDEMDHGPIIAQRIVAIENWAPKKSELYEILSAEGGKLLAEALPKWVDGTITPKVQDHQGATYSSMIEKKHGLLDLSDDAYKNLLKIKAYEDWPGTYFFVKHHDKDIRVKITDADLVDGKLEIKKVVPEGKKEMSYADFLRGHGGLQN